MMATAIFPTLSAPRLSPYVTEVPQKVADAESRKATLYSLASKVCLVAFVAIAAAVLAISFGLLFPIHAALMFGLTLGALPLQAGFQIFMLRSLECSEKAKQASEKAAELARIQHWAKPQIEAFFKEHKLPLNKLPMDLLSRIDPKEPLRALLPAIAFYNYLCKAAQDRYEEHEKNLRNTVEDPTLHYEGRRIGWRKLEFEAIPLALQAAVVLQTIAQPTLQLQLSDLGRCHSKQFDQRRFDQLLDGTDDYFTFKEKGRPALTFAVLQNLVANRNVDGLRTKLFR